MGRTLDKLATWWLEKPAWTAAGWVAVPLSALQLALFLLDKPLGSKADDLQILFQFANGEWVPGRFDLFGWPALLLAVVFLAVSGGTVGGAFGLVVAFVRTRSPPTALAAEMAVALATGNAAPAQAIKRGAPRQKKSQSSTGRNKKSSNAK